MLECYVVGVCCCFWLGCCCEWFVVGGCEFVLRLVGVG